MATFSDISTIARTYLRDFPRFFQVTFDAAGRTYELGHVNIDTSSIWIANYTAGGATTEIASTNYVLDERNGILRLATTPTAGSKLMIEGYYYEWLTPADLNFYSQRALDKHVTDLGVGIGSMSELLINTIGISAICESLWALMSEFSRDIDVITSESVHIPASQRFRMVQGLLGQWEGEYRRHATALNIGFDRIEVFSLRRTSRTTNRLVPLYKTKEFGDYAPMERLWPTVDPGVISYEVVEDDLRTDVFVDTTPRSGQTTNAFY